MFERTMLRTCLCLLCLVVASLLATSAARADALSDARELFSRGRDRRLAGDCPGAIQLFRQSYELYPAGLGSLRNFAECEEAVGHFATAHRAWLELRQALLTRKEEKYEGWDEDAAQGAARSAPKMATLTVDVDAVTPEGRPATSERLDVSVNGEPLNPGLLHTPLDRDPGHYVIRAVGGGGHASAERAIDLASGDGARVELHVVVEPATGRATALSERSAPPSRIAAWAAAGIGAASLVGAGIAALQRQSALDDLNRECGSTVTCTPAAVSSAGGPAKIGSIEDRGHAMATWVNVLAVVGVVGLSSGAVLYVVNRPRSLQAALVASPAGIATVGRF